MCNGILLHRQYTYAQGGSVDVWVCHSRPVADLSILSVAERERADRLRVPSIRDRYVNAHLTARSILGQALGVAPDLCIAHHESGKPWLPGHPEVHYSLSHSDDLVAIAISSAGPAGVDIEICRSIDVDAIATRFFGTKEQSDIRSIETEKLERFYRCWTRKEAYVKFTGEGLTRPLSSFRVSLVDSGEFSVWSHNSEQPLAVAGRSFGEPGRWYGALVTGHQGSGNPHK